MFTEFRDASLEQGRDLFWLETISPPGRLFIRWIL